MSPSNYVFSPFSFCETFTKILYGCQYIFINLILRGNQVNWIQKFSWGGLGVWGRNVFYAMPSGGSKLIFNNFTTVCEFNEFQFTRVWGPYPRTPPLLYSYKIDFFVWFNGFLVKFKTLLWNRVGAQNWPLLHRGGPIPAARVTTHGEVAVVTGT